MAKKERTPEEEKARQARKVAKNQAFDTLKALVDGQQDPKYKVALATIRPSLYGLASPGGGSSVQSRFIDLVVEKKTINEKEVFDRLHIGRKDCAKFIRNGLKKSEPKERQWISFDPQSGNYKLVGTGENPPAGWNGYVPVAEGIDLK